jgi:F-type H+-transporting ATPase subunit b
MRIVIVTLIVACFVAPAFAAEKTESTQPNAAAHGAEKMTQEATHPGESHGGAHEAPKFLGLPAWIWKLVNMLVFFALLGWAIRGPVRNALASRNEQVRHEREEARERRAKADQMATDIQARLTQLEEDVRLIRERAQVEGEKQKREMIAAAEAEAQKILQSARNEVDNRLKHARKELTEYAGNLASERAEKLLREKITDADRQKLFRDSLNEVEGVRS